MSAVPGNARAVPPDGQAMSPDGQAVPHDTRLVFVGHNGAARLDQSGARRILAKVHGMTAAQALHALRFTAGTVCQPIARIVQQAATEAQRRHGLGPESLVIIGSQVGDGETVVRVRRMAHGMADWITTETTDITVELQRVDPNEQD
jgi:ribosomal protein L22